VRILAGVRKAISRTWSPFKKAWAHGKGGRVSVVVLAAGLLLYLSLPLARTLRVDLGWFPFLGLFLGIPLVLAGAAGVRLYGYELTGDASRDIKAQSEKTRKM